MKRRTILFLLIGSILLLLSTRILVSDSAWEDESDITRYREFYELTGDSVDYLLLGPSQAYFDINPMQIYAQTGFRGYTLASACQSLPVSYYWLKEALKTQRPKYVLFDISGLSYFPNELYENFWTRSLSQMRPSLLKLEAILNCSTSQDMRISLLFPLYRFHSRWSQLESNDFHSMETHGLLKGMSTDFSFRNDTLGESINTQLSIDYVIEKGNVRYKKTSYSVSGINKDYFERILELCSEHDIELIPVKCPTLNWDKERNSLVENFLSDYDLTFLNLYQEDSLKIDWATDTSDSGYHLNFYGSTKVSSYIADFMKEYFTVNAGEDLSNQIQMEWTQDLKEYSAWEQREGLSYSLRTYDYLNSLVTAKDDFLTLISVKDDAFHSWNARLSSFFSALGLRAINDGLLQGSYIGIIDTGEVIFDKCEGNKLSLAFKYNDEQGNYHESELISAGYMTGDTSSIRIDGVEYSCNNRGLNIVVVDKKTGTVVSSVSIDTHDPNFTFSKKNLPEASAEKWNSFTDGQQILENGVYTLHPIQNILCAVEAIDDGTMPGSNVVLAENNHSDHQQFRLTYMGDGIYMIQTLCSGQYLTVDFGGTRPGTNLVQDTESGLITQKWFIIRNENDSYSLISPYNGLFFGLDGDTAEAGTNVWLWEDSGLETQQFIIQKVD